MKRSAQIGLLVMGALTTTSAAGYFASNYDRDCEQRTINNPQGQPQQDCRRSVWSNSSGHGSGGGRPIYAGSSSSGTPTATSTPTAGSPSVQRGGFGGFMSHIAHAFSGS
jgi:hypothetical protein